MYWSLLSVSVTVKKCDCDSSVKIKVLSSRIKFSGHFFNSVIFVDLLFKLIKSGFSIYVEAY